MSFATGFLNGIADGKNRSTERKARDRELSILEASLERNRQDPVALARGPMGAVDQGGGGGADSGRRAARGGTGQTFDMSKVSPEIREGIYETATELGVDPIDVAAIISYETAGTFDPRKKGPTTQWGQHEGLIQWGEPQAEEYGVNWDDPIRSQLGKDGAIVRYMRAAGVKPGMGIEDLYSAVNAGRVGRYNATDAHNGGAPGTVLDKVRDQFGGHYDKARSLFDGYTPASARPAAPPAMPGASPTGTSFVLPNNQPTKFRWFENLRTGMNGAN